MACPIEEEGEMHALLISLHHRIKPIFFVGSIEPQGFRGTESPIQAVYEGLAAHDLDQSRHILGHEITELPCIPLHIMLVGSRPEGVQVR